MSLLLTGMLEPSGPVAQGELRVNRRRVRGRAQGRPEGGGRARHRRDSRPAHHCGYQRGRLRQPARLYRADHAGLDRRSRLGGWEESGESRPAWRRSAATSTRSDSISAACSATTASSSAFRAAGSSYDGCSGCGIPEANHSHEADASTNTPQINRGPDWLPPDWRLPGRDRPDHRAL